MLGLGRNVSSVLKNINVTPCRGVLFNGSKTERKLEALRSLCLTSQRWRKLQSPREQTTKKKNEEDDDEEEDDIGKPIRFSTSKASHRTWNVERSFGSKYKRPWWRVLTISLLGVGFLIWCAFRKESEIDEQLEKPLSEHLPGLLYDEDDEKTKPGS